MIASSNRSVTFLTLCYLIALALVALLAIVGQVLVQGAIERHASDAHLIKIAGRQRMLSQRLTLLCLQIRYAPGRDRAGYLEELRWVLTRWDCCQTGLRNGDPDQGLPGRNPRAIRSQLAALEPHFEAMRNAARTLLQVTEKTPAEQNVPAREQAKPAREQAHPRLDVLVGVVLDHEPEYLKGMEEVVDQYEEEAAARIGSLRRTELALLVITLLVLLAEALLLFRPAVRRVRRILQQKTEAEDQLARQNQQLHEALQTSERATRAKSEFLAHVSQEIRTPLNGVVGLTGLLLELPLSQDQRDGVETVRTSGESLLTILSDILDFSTIEKELLELETQPFDLRVCIAETLDLLASRASEKQIELAYLVEDAVPGGILGDSTRVRQILGNLVSNGVKFSHRGEVVVSVRLAGERRGVSPPVKDRRADAAPLASQSDPVPAPATQLLFAVRDTGIGIPPERMDRLFQAFSQVDARATRRFGGTGLGLAISKRLCELMGGCMWVESQPGTGSTFYFTLPLLPAPLADSSPSGTLQACRHACVPAGGPVSPPSEREVPAPLAPVLDRSTLQGFRTTMGSTGHEVVNTVLRLFLEDAPRLAASLKQGLAEGNLKVVQRGAHTLRSNCETFGALELARLCGDLETSCRQASPQNGACPPGRISEQVEAVEAALPAVLQAVQNELEPLKNSPRTSYTDCVHGSTRINTK